MQPADAVLRFLESVGRRSEAEFYLQLFRAEPREQFAAISVGAHVAREALDAVVLDLRFLTALGLVPAVLLGLFAPAEALEKAGRLKRRLEAAGVPARLLAADDPALHETARQCMREGVVPLIPFGAASSDLQERFASLGALLSFLRTRKLIFLHSPGGLRQRGALVPLVNLSTETEKLLVSPELTARERALLAQSRRLVFDLVPHRLLVAVTSPLNLLRELFTVKGAGTLLRRGAAVTRRPGLAGLDQERLRALLASSFGRAPLEEFFVRPVSHVYLEEDYRGAAIVATTWLGSYLSKFAVGREAQGEGIGRDLWDAMTADHPVLYWRARPQNPIGEWYARVADGLARFAEWTVYWIGLPTERIPAAIADALGRPPDFPPPPAPEQPPATLPGVK